MSNIIDKIQLSGVTYDLPSGGSVTVDPTLNSGSTNPVANSAITEAVTANQKNVWVKTNTLYSFFEYRNNITYNFAVGSAANGQRINIAFGDGGNEVWEYNGSSWSCTSTSLESPHYTVSQDGKLWVFTQNDDEATVNRASIESPYDIVEENLTFVLLETTDVIPSETLGQRVGRIERVLKSLDGMAFPLYKRNYKGSSVIGNTAVAQINTQTGEISYSDSGYNLFGLDAKTFGWEQNIGSIPNGKLTFTKYVIDKDVLLRKTPEFSIDVSSIEGESYINNKSLMYMKVWAIKTNPNYSQPFADFHMSIEDTGNTTTIADISFMYDQNRGLTIEDMLSRTSMSYPNFKFGDTVVADFNGVFPSGDCNIRIYNWEGSNSFVSSIDFYELWTSTDHHSDYVILFDEWMNGIEERFSELDDKEEATAKAFYDLKDAKQDTLVSGTNIKTINNESLLGSGNIDIQGGGGKAVSGGTNISITTGETADTINCTLPIIATSGVFKTISVGQGSGGGSYNTLIGPNAKCDNNNGHNVFLVAQNSSNSNQGAYVNGTHNVIIGAIKTGELAFNMPSFTASRSVVVGGGGISTDKDNSVAIGYKANVSGTTKTNINNQLTIDTSNQVYIYNKDNTEMICLQDQLGGGGASYSAGTGIDITNDVISVTGMTDSSAFTAHTANTTVHTTAAEKTSWNGAATNASNAVTALGGLSLVKLTQAEYSAMEQAGTLDNSTLYIVTDS